MKNTNEKSLIVKKNNLFNRILCFFRNVFSQNKTKLKLTAENKVENKIYLNKNKFESNLKVDETKYKLLNIQRQLTNNGINKENLLILTKDLTQDEIRMLIELYKEQNESLNNQLSMYKNKILILKKQI